MAVVVKVSAWPARGGRHPPTQWSWRRHPVGPKTAMILPHTGQLDTLL